MRTLLVAAVLLSLLGTVNTARASRLVEVSVVDRHSGRALQAYRYQGALYVAGSPGSSFAIVLKNRDGGRVLVVLSVDGVNAVSGETAAVRQTGYVLDPYASAEISGWRKSLSHVAGFVFTPLPASYAALTGRPQNVGVIGVAVFREQPRADKLISPEARREAPQPQARAEERLGTGHGERQQSAAHYVDFQRATEQPAQVIRIYYDSYSNLIARGVVPRPAQEPELFPEPFPGRFVPDPVG